MKLYLKDKSHVDRGTATLRRAVELAKNWKGYKLAEDYDSHYLYNQQDLNCSGIQSKLIEYVGRWTEDYGSDLICTLTDLDAFVRDDDTVDAPHGRWIIAVGIRTSGVDHNAWVMSRVKDTMSYHGYLNPKEVYNKVLAIDIEDELAQDSEGDYYRNRNIALYDITNTLNCLESEDR